VNNVLREARPANFKDANGRVVVVGKTAGVQSDVLYPGVPNARTTTANLCGYARISNSTTNPAPATFVYGGTTYTTSSLPTQVPNRCIDGNKFVYQP
jgi:Iap family predicted aminopeptidase